MDVLFCFPSFCKLLITQRSMCVVQPVASVDVVVVSHCTLPDGPPHASPPILSSSSVGVDDTIFHSLFSGEMVQLQVCSGATTPFFIFCY